MDPSSTTCRVIASSIFVTRVSRTSATSIFRCLFNFYRSQRTPISRISLHNITISSSPQVVTRANGRRLRLLPYHILNFVRSSRQFFRHPTTRMDRQHRFSSITISRLLRLIVTRRVHWNIMRKTRMKVSLFLWIPKRRTRLFPNLSDQPNRSSPFGFTILRMGDHRNRNRVNLTHPNQPSTRDSRILTSKVSMTLLTRHLKFSRATPNEGTSDIFVGIIRNL